MASVGVAVDRWAERRRRAAELADRWPFAAEVLTFYRFLLDVQERIYEDAVVELPDPSEVAAYVADRAVPLVREVAAGQGPEALAQAVAEEAPPEVWGARVGRWLAGEDLPSAHRFVCRAAAGPVLEALGSRVEAGDMGPGGGRRCPQCGGLPQLSLFAPSAEDLVAPRRFLECSRCAWRWPYPRMTCPSCGETDAQRLPIFAEEGAAELEATGNVVRGVGGAASARSRDSGAWFPHLSIHACRTCSLYLVNVDLSRDRRAVPVVDEMAAIPLDLYARDQGVTKIVPNLMGL